MKNNKSLGQHWLKNRAILDQIAALAARDADSDTVCLEIGPGLGTLTSSLLKRFTKVVAVEYDERLAANLPKSFPGKNLTVIRDDILDSDIPKLVQTDNYVVVGNIPYYITSPIVQKLIRLSPTPQAIVLLMQKEVAERIAAVAGNHSLLSLTVQSWAESELGPAVLGAEFTPPPKVDSQVLILHPLVEPLLTAAGLNLATRGFKSPRKKLASNLADSDHSKADWQQIFSDFNLNPDARAADLTIWDWNQLAEHIAKS